ncbi:phosphoenolpyruvate carboxykinase (GTP) [Marinicella litoralis]|uniref:Phosphoenolpyruvate carboxykinase [GTP] n=1 Tax=Marinicella litoralis TaxID=644220 RepID=A0A4R6XM12_9GAMM|nr:phosphoenolpyruvate carboxykinase (GTP) [Marinicella litoralis]TDR20616.1 phosphoenolpyruvate carboxykinase (GTP) [Marinicella litoralis]
MSTTNQALADWVKQVAELTQPDQIYWCDGSEAEDQKFNQMLLDDGSYKQLNSETHPNCYLHLSDSQDVARVEHLTFICTQKEVDAGPNNHWMDPAAAHDKIDALFAGCMKGRTMYVIPYCMGPIDSPIARCGVEITDSAYVVQNMRLMTRMGQAALSRIEQEGGFVKGLHSTGELDPNRRFIMHFPEELSIKSFGSGYGGNALLGKKCHALRIASYQAKTEGWLAEHMLILGIKTPAGKQHYVAAAFPSACGKTNLAMLIPPEGYLKDGWEISTVGDDICWMRPGEDGRLWAINPEAGFFGVAPGTAKETNPNALAMLYQDTIFTNVAETADGQPWWEGLDDRTPQTDWQGRPYDPANGPAAHPNSRFTVSAKRCPSYSAESESATGVPIDAIIFGGRRASLVPLVTEARSWDHGVLMGATVASETTAAATGAVGVVRRDPMAMKPFCGYHFGDYWGHWVGMKNQANKLPKVFTVNWFRKDEKGQFMWPGFGENMRVLEWIIGRCDNQLGANETAIGLLPSSQDINTKDLGMDLSVLDELLKVDKSAWKDEVTSVEGFLRNYGSRVPGELFRELKEIDDQLS